MKKPRFSLATIFWIVTTCSLALGWYANRSSLLAENQKLGEENEELLLDNGWLTGTTREFSGSIKMRLVPLDQSTFRRAAIERTKRRLEKRSSN